MVDFNDAISFLIDVGAVHVLAPFILIFAIVFAILQKSQMFEGGSMDDSSAKKINSVIAFVFGIFAVIAANVVDFIGHTLATAAIVIVLILCMLLVLGFILGKEYTELFKDSRVKYGILIVTLILTIGFIFTIFNIWDWINDLFSSASTGLGDWTGLVIMILVIIGSIYFVTKSSKDDDD